jgi:hypothetical protein
MIKVDCIEFNLWIVGTSTLLKHAALPATTLHNCSMVTALDTAAKNYTKASTVTFNTQTSAHTINTAPANQNKKKENEIPSSAHYYQEQSLNILPP